PCGWWRHAGHAGAGAGREVSENSGNHGVSIDTEVAAFGDDQSPSRGTDHQDIREVRGPGDSRSATFADRSLEATGDAEQPGRQPVGAGGEPAVREGTV